jgi:hypothetical protein
VSFVLWVFVGVWGISSGKPHGTSLLAVYIAVALFVLLGIGLIMSILFRLFAKPRAGIIRKF